MNRRTFLQRSGVVGALALAGCTTDGDPAGSDEPTDTSTPTQSPTATETLTVTESSVETTETSCSSGAASATVAVGDGTVDFSGRLHAPTPCYEVVVESTRYDADGGELTVSLGVENTGEVCIECVGALVFEGSVSFEGGNLTEATIEYDGEIVASTRNDVPTPTPADAPTLDSASFELREGSSGTVTDAADVRFDTETNTVVVTGTIPGKNGCMTAALGGVDFDANESVLSVDVVTRRREGTEGDVCTEQILPLPYETKIAFEGGLPATVTVSHDGDSLLTGTHASTTAASPDE